MKKYGNFSENGKEFIITDTDIPKHWDNYLWNDSFCCRLIQDGSGESLYKHKGGMRTMLTKGQRLIFIRDNDKKSFWTVPGKGAGEPVTYGMGYTKYRSEEQAIAAELQISVPEKINGEAWMITINNCGSRIVNLSIFSYIDLDLTGYATPFVVQCYNNTFDSKLNSLIFENKDAYCPTTNFNAFIATDTKVTSFESVGELFLGSKRDLKAPQAVVQGKCSSQPYEGGGGNHIVNDMVGVLQFDIILKPGETKAIQIISAIFEDKQEIEDAVKSFLIPGGFDQDLSRQKELSEKFMKNFSIETPDKELNRLSNGWLKHNLRFVTRWTRIYSRGFRDCLQDTMGVASLDAKATKENILLALSHVYKSGLCKRAWDNLANTLSTEFYADGPIWIPLTINEYIRETGDTAILSESIPYFDGGSGTVLEHMLRAVRFLHGDRGEHGLCRIHDGDWCDTAHLLGKEGRGEGVWLSIALYNALNEVAQLAEFLKDSTLKGEMERMAAEVKESVNLNGWDGNWFLIAYNDAGEAVGSAKSNSGQLFLNPQSWAVLSGITTADREAKCLDAIDNKLDSGIGPLLLTKPFTEENKKIGTLTSFAPGTIENGSCYCHAASFKMVADCKRGRGNKAYETLRKIIPGGDADQANEAADCPPYAFTNSRFALFHPYLAGRSLGTWNTGTISWCWQTITEWMLGIRKTFEGLILNPCIPAKWDGFKATRIYRETFYDIEVTNPKHIEKGIQYISVNGQTWNSAALPIEKGKRFSVKVVMG
ncbi:MAG: hypothetical protein JNL74_01080 [Fibrobacteres bacterium]|nr:hypothetical protein [Fibrobacterota bacterium]